MNSNIIATEIFDFAELLVFHNIIQDAKSLYDASAKMQRFPDAPEWQYECGNLKFSIEGSVAGAIPQKISLIEVIFNVSVVGNYQNNKNEPINPLIQLTFDIEIEGFGDFDGKIDTFYASWHLDKHISSDRSAYVHPEYHLAFGGNNLEAKGNIFGSTLILPSPRIVHPPMDAILGVDFILQNFFPLSKIKKLLEESRYKEIISNAQDRLWRPYYMTLASAWNNFPDTTFRKGFEYFNLNPHLNKN